MKAFDYSVKYSVSGMLLLFSLAACALSDNPSRDFFALYGDDLKQEDFENKTSKFVQKSLGPPRHIWHETPAQVWQYTTPECILDVVFYPDPNKDATKATTKDIHAAYFSSRTREGQSLPVSECLTFVAASKPQSAP